MFKTFLQAFGRLLRTAQRLMLHRVLFRSATGPVFFFDLTEDHPVDGKVIAYSRDGDQVSISGYWFDNRHMADVSPFARCNAVFTEVLLSTTLRPVAVVEHDEAFTPFGKLPSLPPRELRSLRHAPSYA